METIEILMTVWFFLTALSLLYLIYDMVTNTPLLWVMALAWVLIILYAGPIGILLYIYSCRKPANMTHSEFIKPHWKQAVGSMMHCIAGDATGIILAAALVHSFGLPNGIDLIVEYAGAFIVGLLVFQALFMLKMYGNYWVAVRKTFFAETVSMNMVMVGMFPAMVILKHLLQGGEDPLEPLFWFVTSIAVLVSGVTAYPINSWLVSRGVKHGMMSAPEPGVPAMEMGGAGGKASDHGAPKHERHDISGMNHAMMKHEGHDMGGMSRPGKHKGRYMNEMEHGTHGGKPLPMGQQLGIIFGTFALLVLVLIIVGQFAPIRFS